MNVITNVNWGKKTAPVEPALFEPEIISCVLITGASAKVGIDVVTFMGWTLVDGEEEERRITVRFAMPLTAATDLCKTLNDQLSQGGVDLAAQVERW
jgi:hypothetical protein